MEVSKTTRSKINALLMKAADAAATPSEAEAAMAAAQKLMKRHDLTDADLNKVGDGDFRLGEIKGNMYKGKGYLHPIDKLCAVSVGKYCGVQPWVVDENGEVQLRYLGLDADAELFHWMLAAFREQFEHDWVIYKRFQMATKRLLDLKEARRAFARGFATAVSDRLAKWGANNSPEQGTPVEGGGTALVLKKHLLVQDEMLRLGLHLSARRGTSKTINDAAAFGAGKLTGSRVESGRAAGGKAAIAISAH